MSAPLGTIESNLLAVRARIERAALRAGRDPRDVLLLAVSKTKPLADIEAAHAAGARDFGENYAQELAEKQPALTHLQGIRWHFVGRLQTNKAKLVAKIATMVHAVDSARLATELGKRAEGRTTPLEVLVEVNVGAETSKGGVVPSELEPVLRAIDACSALRLRGLMSIPPHTETPEESRRFHRTLRELRDVHGGATRLPHLSMGMTDDLEVAVEEGATIVRIGTAIFGARARDAPPT